MTYGSKEAINISWVILSPSQVNREGLGCIKITFCRLWIHPTSLSPCLQCLYWCLVLLMDRIDTRQLQSGGVRRQGGPCEPTKMFRNFIHWLMLLPEER